MPTLLVVEDNHDVRRLLKAVLERRGYRVLPAASPSQAIAAAETHAGSIDLALIDVVLPEMPCGDCVARIRSDNPDMKLVFMSGYPQHIARVRGALDDDGEFLMKPFTPELLLSVIGRSLAPEACLAAAS